MLSLTYFDVSVAGNSRWTQSGQAMPVSDFVSLTLGLDHAFTREFNSLIEHADFDVYGIRKPRIWEKLIRTVIFCLSGQMPDTQELLRGRQIIHRLPTWFKKRHLNKQFVLCFLPYVLIGFKAHIEDRFHSDSNIIDDICRFIVHLFESDQVEIISYLCAHRGLNSAGQHRLISSVHLQKAKRTLNLQLALLKNAEHLKSRRIVWYQQGPTAMASSNMFPEMFIRYLEEGAVPEMLLLLEEHFRELQGMMARQADFGVELQVANLDEVSAATHAYLEAEFGQTWKTQTFELPHPSKNPLMPIALEQVMPVVKRMIPFYGHSMAAKFGPSRASLLARNLAHARELESERSLPDIVARTEESINWFYNNQLMHISAKALYEAAFFYVWGRYVGANGGRIAIGIDRDHSQYQHSAWMLGYSSSSPSSKESTAVVYMRRNPTEIEGGVLNDISFRQFWR